MKFTHLKASLAFIVMGLALSLASGNAATAAQTRVGQMTCVADAPPSDSKATWPMACNFEPVNSKTSQRFDGQILGMVPSARREAKLLIVWSVLTVASEVKATDLVGTYRAKAEHPTSLFAQSGEIELQSIAPTEQGANIDTALRIIQLELPKV